jgi:hypothetical protein
MLEEVRRRELLPQDSFDVVEEISMMRSERDAEVLGLVSRCDW